MPGFVLPVYDFINDGSLFSRGFTEVNAGGFNAGMAQDVRQLCNVLVDPVINRGKQMPEIMGKYLGGLHIGFLTEPLHLSPDLASYVRYSDMILRFRSRN